MRRRFLLYNAGVFGLGALAGCVSRRGVGDEGTASEELIAENQQSDDDSPERLSDADVSVSTDIEFARPDDDGLELDLYLPETDSARPAVVVVYGGGWEQGNKSQLGWHAEQLAQRGFVAAAVEYRLSPEWEYPAAVQDVNAAIAWLRTNGDEYGIDGDRIATFGWSSGAHLVALTGVATEVDAFVPSTVDPAATSVQAVVGVGGYYDFRLLEDETNEAVEQFLEGTASDAPDRYREASPAVHVDPDDPPTLLYHAPDDEVVSIEQSQVFVRTLERNGVDAALVTPDDGGHDFVREAPWNERSVEQVSEFLYRLWQAE